MTYGTGAGPGVGTGAELPAAAIRGLADRWLPLMASPGSADGHARSDGAGAGDFVCSPAGLWLALAAVAVGAREETAGELRELLGVAGEKAAGVVTAAARALASTDALAVATRVWSRVPVYRAHREALPDIGFGPMDPDGIDAWVREATNGLIERLPVVITPDVLLVLVNALALKARWEIPFEGAGTRDQDFTDALGVRHRVPTMHRPVPLNCAWTVGGASVVELKCRAEGGRAPARVRFVLGEPGAGAAEVLPLAWAPEGRWTGIDAEQINMTLPRMSLRTRVDATEQLAALGVRWAMSEGADFSGMSPERLAISQVVQEAVVKIAEEGVEAAAVTAVPMAPGGAYVPRRIEWIAFNRPFGVVVLDGGGEVPLFTAWQAGVPG
ncbi:serpin family protein [Streptomyces sp. NBC_01283]|uniref:serpin family protein n=1 Tax=Streptomyces sp. NBC_01283 TaxID=2903812 RepID=UPI00352F050D